MARQDIARDAERAHIEAIGQAAVRCGDADLQPSRLAEQPHQQPTGAVDVPLVFLDMGAHHLSRPILETSGEVSVPRLEEWPGEEAAVGH